MPNRIDPHEDYQSSWPISKSHLRQELVLWRVPFVLSFRYKGFSALELFKVFIALVSAKSYTYDEVADDLYQMLGLFHVRGPMKEDNTAEHAAAIKDINSLVSKYSIKT